VLLGAEAALFASASLIHAGVLLQGFEHRRASTAEAVIATVLMVGLVAGLVRPARLRTVSVAAQAFALLGTLVGMFTIAIGVGPQTTADLIFHLAVLALLLGGLVTAFTRTPHDSRSHQGAST